MRKFTVGSDASHVRVSTYLWTQSVLNVAEASPQGPVEVSVMCVPAMPHNVCPLPLLDPAPDAVGKT
jgi:hypothetical protein